MEIFKLEFLKKNFILYFRTFLEGLYFYNFTTPEFNVNVCQLTVLGFNSIFILGNLLFKTDKKNLKFYSRDFYGLRYFI